MQNHASSPPASARIRLQNFLTAFSVPGRSAAVDRPRWIWAERRYFQFCLAASAFLFLVSSVFSTGTHNPDEYFQTIEFTSAKLSITDPAELTWEYREEMRPWLQPAIYVGVARAAGHLGIHRPLTLLFLFRLVTAFIAWSSLWTLVAAGRHWIDGEAERRRLYSIAAFLWLLPLLGVRTSGETFATSALCFGIALLEWRAGLRSRGTSFGIAALAGLAFGLCFDFRYASGVMAAGAGLWYLRAAEGRISLLAGLALGVLLALVLGGLADWWGYGDITFPAYSYLYQNFVLGRSAKDFGADPFFAYLYLPFLESGAMAPLVFALLLATLIAWRVRARSVLTWATAPYVALLCIAAHKEARFLFPLAPFLPFFVVFALSAQPPVGARLASFPRWLASGYRLKFGYLLNACGLLGVVLLPQGANFPLYELIEEQSFAAHGPIEAVVVHGPNNLPYWYVGHRMAFLEPKNLRWISEPSVTELEAIHARGKTFLALIDIPVRSPEPTAWIRSRCAFAWSTWPRWLEPYNFNHWQERSHWWELYRCGGAQ
jgi:GPI mannosyltransferase 3